jgi:UDP-N-acetylmuramate--alanine ligase
MIGWILEQCGADPTVVNGAPVVNWVSSDMVGNVRCGRPDLWVLEADESDRSLLQFHPAWAVITNVSADHFGLAESEALFRRFARQVSRGVVSALDPPAEFGGVSPVVSAASSRFLLKGVEFKVPLPGGHNAANAMFAAALCERLGVSLRESARALAGFRGVVRRLQVVGTADGVAVVDDYGHNPAKISAAVGAVGPYARRVTAVWRPHGYGPLAAMLEPLADTWVSVLDARRGDELLLLPVYDAGGSANRTIDSGALADAVSRRGGSVRTVRDYDDVIARVCGSAASGDAVLVMGARDRRLPELARSLVDALGRR